jgi:hypothetical protein
LAEARKIFNAKFVELAEDKQIFNAKFVELAEDRQIFNAKFVELAEDKQIFRCQIRGIGRRQTNFQCQIHGIGRRRTNFRPVHNMGERRCQLVEWAKILAFNYFTKLGVTFIQEPLHHGILKNTVLKCSFLSKTDDGENTKILSLF